MDTEGKDRLFGGLAAAAEAADPANPAAKDALFTALYGELHRLAESHLRKSAGNLTLGTTTLLHEAYLDISQRERLAFPDRSRFFAYASRAMRGLVIDYIRQRKAQKRGGDLTFTTLEDGHGGVGPDDQQVLALGDALEHLGVADPPWPSWWTSSSSVASPSLRSRRCAA